MQYKLVDTSGKVVKQIDLPPLDGKVGEQVITEDDGRTWYLLATGEMTFERSGVVQEITVGTLSQLDEKRRSQSPG